MTSAAGTAEGLRERGKRRRVQRILDATRELLREEPDRSPSVERIAARAEVAPATVFNLVGTRDQLWAALMDQTLEELTRRVGGIDGAAPHTRARRIARVTAEVIAADPHVHRTVVGHLRDSARLLRRDPTSEIVACLAAAVADGTLRPDADVERLGGLVRAACTGALHQWAAGLIGRRAFADRCAWAVDVAFAAAATTPEQAADFLA